MLASYEYKDGPGYGGFYAHMGGLKDLIKVRGHSLVQDQESRSLLKAFRDRTIIGAIHCHAALPVTREQHPWFYQLLQDSDFDRLQVIALSLPALAQRRTALLGGSLSDRKKSFDLMNDASHTLGFFNAWHTTLLLDEPARSGITDPATSMTLRWYFTCKLLCLQIINISLQDLLVGVLSVEEHRKLDITRNTIVCQMQESFESICLSVSTLRRDGHRVLENDAEIEFLPLAASGYM